MLFFQTLKKLEEEIKQEGVSHILDGAIKVIHIVDKMGFKLAIAGSMGLVLSTIFSFLPLTTGLISLISLGAIRILKIDKIACKVSVFTLDFVKRIWVEKMFCLKIQPNKNQIQILYDWTQLKNLSEIQKHLISLNNNIEFAPKFGYYSHELLTQFNDTKFLLSKINNFQIIEKKVKKIDPKLLYAILKQPSESKAH